MLDQNEKKQILAPSDPRWEAFVESIPNASIFHHPAWINLFSECYGYRSFVIALCNDKHEIISGLPIVEVNSPIIGRKWISLPFTDHCNPLCRDKMSLRELFKQVSELRIREAVSRFELKGEIILDNKVHKENRQFLHILRLSPDSSAIYKNFHRTKVQQCIAKAQREGVTVRWAETKDDLDTYYNLHWTTRHRLGVLVQPKRYFELIWKQIIEAGLGFILLAYKDSVPIAGGVFLTYKNTLVCKYAASDKNYWPLNPNHLMYWTAIRWGCEHQFITYDWGKSHINNTGLRNFKNGWGAQETVLTYSILSDNPHKRNSDRLSSIAGPIIRRVPRWMCRITSELLYKHFA